MNLTTALEYATISEPEIWVEKYGDSLYAFAFSRVRDKSLAEDLVQETLLSAIQSRRSFSGKATEKTWLIGILKHKVIDHFRKSSKQVSLTDEEADMSSYDYLYINDGGWSGHYKRDLAPITWSGTPEDALERSEFRNILTGCLSELPGRIADAFTLREVEGLKSEEICDVLRVSSNNYWVMIHRARLHLRRCIEFNWFRGT